MIFTNPGRIFFFFKQMDFTSLSVSPSLPPFWNPLWALPVTTQIHQKEINKNKGESCETWKIPLFTWAADPPPPNPVLPLRKGPVTQKGASSLTSVPYTHKAASYPPPVPQRPYPLAPTPTSFQPRNCKEALASWTRRPGTLQPGQ